MVKTKHIACLCLAVALAIAGDAAARAANPPVLVVGIPTPANPPFVVSDGDRVGGLIGETVLRAVEEMGFAVTIEPLPFARLYQRIHDGEIDVAMSVLRTDERARRAWYSKPIVTEFTILVSSAHAPMRVTCLGTLRDIELAGRIGFAYPLVDRAGIRLERENSYEKLIRRAVSGRIDGVLLGSISGPYLMRQMGLESELFVAPQALGSASLGAALSKSRFDAEAIAAFDRLVAVFRRSDRWRALYARFDIEHTNIERPIMPLCGQPSGGGPT